MPEFLNGGNYSSVAVLDQEILSVKLQFRSDTFSLWNFRSQQVRSHQLRGETVEPQKVYSTVKGESLYQAILCVVEEMPTQTDGHFCPCISSTPLNGLEHTSSLHLGIYTFCVVYLAPYSYMYIFELSLFLS